MVDRQDVVIVDGLPETAEVLRAIFEPRGMHVSRIVSKKCTGTAWPGDVLQASGAGGVLVVHEITPKTATGSRVVVGRLMRQAAGSPLSPADSDCIALPQPFHYADLIAAIDAVTARPAA